MEQLKLFFKHNVLSSVYLQMFFVLVVSLNMNVIGTGVGWSAIVPKIQMDNATDFVVTDTDVRWLGE